MKYHNQIIKVTAIAVSIVGFVNSSFAITQTAEATINPVPLPRVVNPNRPPPPVLVPPSTSYFKINITHQTQEYMLCVPTSASMMASKAGWNYPPRQIKLATLGLPWYGPTTPFNYWTPISLSRFMVGARSLNLTSWRTECYSLSDFQRGLDEIKDSVRKGFPVMIIVWYTPTIGHAMVVSGYDDKNQRLILNDPGMSSPGLAYYSYKSLRDNYWKNTSGNRWVVYMNQKTSTAPASIMLLNTRSSTNKVHPDMLLEL
jgi:hypothetical protein